MKKKLLSALVIFTASMMLVGVNSLSAKTNVPAGTVIKGKGNSTLYYLEENGKRYVFPNANTYFSWYDDFSKVKEIELKDLEEIQLGGNVNYKPGAVLVKIQTDPKVYAVGANGKLRWVKSEAVAKALYGENWNKLVDDVPDSFFTNYNVGEAIEASDDYEPIEEEEQAPTISHNKGLKALAKVKTRNANEKMCGRLEGALERLQKRFERWGVDINDEANEVLEKCYSVKDDLSEDKKATICHKGETIEVAKRAAVKGHLKHGDTLGECAASDDAVPDSEGDEPEDSDSATSTDDVIDDSDTGTSTDDSIDDSETEEDGEEDSNASSSDETTE